MGQNGNRYPARIGPLDGQPIEIIGVDYMAHGLHFCLCETPDRLAATNEEARLPECNSGSPQRLEL